MALKTGKHNGSADPVMTEFDVDTATLDDGTKVKFPTDKVKIVEQDPAKPHFFQDLNKAGVKFVLPDGGNFFLIRGATRGAVMAALRRCELGV